MSQAVEKSENALLKELMKELSAAFLSHQASTKINTYSYVFMNALNRAYQKDLTESKDDLLSAQKLAFCTSQLWNYPLFEDKHRLEIFREGKVEDLSIMKDFMNAYNPKDLPGDLKPLFSDVE